MMNTVMQDVRYGIRVLLKNRGFTFITVLTFALGIGMNTAIFSVMNGVVLRTLPMPHPERIVVVSSTVKREQMERRPVSYPDFLDWRNQNNVFEEMAAFEDFSFTVGGKEGAERYNGEVVSSQYFSILGVKSYMGSLFGTKEERSSPVALLSYSLWEQRFDRSSNIIGSKILLDGHAFTVLGILPQGFRGLDDDTEIWIPISSLSFFDKETLELRGRRGHNVIARLKPGVTIEKAQSQMTTIATRLERDYPDFNSNYGALLIPFREEILGDTSQLILILFFAVIFVLLIACSNVANLLLVRTAGRQKELSLRTALGATTARILRLMMTESLLLSCAGGLIGLAVASLFLDVLMAFNPVSLPSFVRIEIDATVLGFTFLISVCTGLIVGAIPAMHVARMDVQEAIKEASTQTSDSGRKQNIRGFLVVSEIALALLLLVGAGLMIRTLQHLQSIDPGFRKENLMSMRISLPAAKYQEDRIWNFSTQLLSSIANLPDVQSVALTSDIPLEGSASARILTVEEHHGQEARRVYVHAVSPGYFHVAGISLLRGREFSDQDSVNAPPAVIVSRTMANRCWPNQNPVGKRLKFGRRQPENPWMFVVGVAADVKHRVLNEDPLVNPDDPDVYLPLAQNPETDIGLLVRTKAESKQLGAALRHSIQRLDRDIPVYAATTMQSLFSQQTAVSRFSAFLMTILGVLALVLASVGIYGVCSYTVTQRTREIGIRISLGAQKQQVFGMILRQAFAWTSLGLVAGLLAAYGLTRLISSRLYGISPVDPLTYAAISIILLAVTFIAISVPARRATNIDPIAALRYN